MEIVISKNYESLSLNAAASIELKMQSKTNPLICVASGDTPSGVYQQIVARVKAGQLNISNWHFLGLDEWVGMNGSNEGSCRHYLDQALFHPLSIPEKSICFFDGCASNLEKECIKSENTIEEKSGIEIAILGLGMNGHIGMNEPNTSKQTRSHIVDLDPLTIAVGQNILVNPKPYQKESH